MGDMGLRDDRNKKTRSNGRVSIQKGGVLLAILQVNKVSKLFGANPEQGIQLLEQGWSKARIAKEKNITVGVNRVSFDIHEGEIFVIMGLSGAVNLHWSVC